MKIFITSLSALSTRAPSTTVCRTAQWPCKLSVAVFGSGGWPQLHVCFVLWLCIYNINHKANLFFLYLFSINFSFMCLCCSVLPRQRGSTCAFAFFVVRRVRARSRVCVYICTNAHAYLYNFTKAPPMNDSLVHYHAPMYYQDVASRSKSAPKR